MRKTLFSLSLAELSAPPQLLMPSVDELNLMLFERLVMGVEIHFGKAAP
jgi:hypothetical protein